MPIVFETDVCTDTFTQCTSILSAFNNNSVCHPCLPCMIKLVLIILFASLVAHHEKKKWQQQQSSSTVWKRTFASMQNKITAQKYFFSFSSTQNRSYDRNGYKRWTCPFSSWAPTFDCIRSFRVVHFIGIKKKMYTARYFVIRALLDLHKIPAYTTVVCFASFTIVLSEFGFICVFRFKFLSRC